MYLVPYKVIHRALDPEKGELDTSRMMAARAVVRHLLQEVLTKLPFDEAHYLDCNSDVASAIRRGEITNGHTHYISDGYFEDRNGGGADFDENWYLKYYPDVALAVKLGQWRSGQHHYEERGMFEWRGPNQSVLLDVERWQSLLKLAAESQDFIKLH